MKWICVKGKTLDWVYGDGCPGVGLQGDGMNGNIEGCGFCAYFLGPGFVLVAGS